jgi:hypothetical protein
MLVLAGCQTVGDLTRDYDPRERPEQKAYEQAVEPYLARGAVHQGPATELMVTVLPLTPAVRRAMASREAAARGWDRARMEARLAELDADAAAGLEMMVCLYAPEKARADLLAARPDWTLALTGADGKTVSPGDVRLVKDRDALREALYPFWGPWDRLHRLRFPGLAPGQSEATLTVSGAPGRAELRIKLD